MVSFEFLTCSHHPKTQADYNTTLINLSCIPREDAAYSPMGKGLNYAVSPAVLPIEDILTDVEKAIVSVPVEAAVEVREQTFRTLKVSGRPRSNLYGPERWALRSLRTNADLTVLQADKGKATMFLNTKDFNENVSAILRALPYLSEIAQGPHCGHITEDHHLLSKSSLPEEAVQQLRPQSSTPQRLYGLPNIHKERSLCGVS
jgi:hypothetical protein